MISVEGDFVRTCCTGEGEFGIKRGNIGVLAGFGLFLAGIAAIQAPLIMMSQNRQEAKDRKRAENDYRVNLKSEFVIDELYRKLEQVSENQKKILKLLEKPSDTDKKDD